MWLFVALGFGAGLIVGAPFWSRHALATDARRREWVARRREREMRG